MRILKLTNLYPSPPYPHRAAYNRQYVKALVAAGHEVRVIAPIAWTDEWWASRNGRAPVPKGRRVECDGVPVEHPRYLFPPKFLRNSHGWCYRRSVKGAFDRAVAEFKPDVVFSSWAYPDGAVSVDLGHAAGLPVVVKVVGSDVLLADAARQRLVAGGLRRADGVMAVSRDLAAHVRSMGVEPSRIRVIYNGVNTDLFSPGDKATARAKLSLPADAATLLFVGNLVPVKGIDVLIDALALLARRSVPFDCHLIGHGTLRGELEQRSAAAGLAGRLKFVGPVRHETLPDWFRAADLFVLPSRSEGVPNVLLEASACGTPFVASRVGGIPEILHLGDGRLVESCDPAALADAIIDRLSNPTRASAKRPEFRSFGTAAAEVAEFLALTRDRFFAHHSVDAAPAAGAMAHPVAGNGKA